MTFALTNFPCTALPEEARQAKLLGIYEERPDGAYFQRIRLPGGLVQAAQWRVLAQVAETFSGEHPVRLTTRQDLEFHGLSAEVIPSIQKLVESAGMTSLGSGGDSFRNVGFCQNCPGGFHLRPLAARIEEAVRSIPGISELPRKFKISLSCSPYGCARPYLQDLGFVAQNDGTFKVVVAGSLGPKPGLGVDYPAVLLAAEVPMLVVAAVRLFAQEGDRTNRSRARLRHVRERLGDLPFLARLDALFREERATGQHRFSGNLERTVVPQVSYALPLPDGILAPSSMRALADLIEETHGSVSLGFEHDLRLRDLPLERLPTALRAHLGRPRVVACPGALLCKKGAARTGALGQQLRERLPAHLSLWVALTGCPNNCALPAVADIGLVGQMKLKDGQPAPHFRLFLGGGHGKSRDLAREVPGAIPEERAAGAVLAIVERYRLNKDGLSFRSFVQTHWDALVTEMLAHKAEST